MAGRAGATKVQQSKASLPAQQSNRIWVEGKKLRLKILLNGDFLEDAPCRLKGADGSALLKAAGDAGLKTGKGGTLLLPCPGSGRYSLEIRADPPAQKKTRGGEARTYEIDLRVGLPKTDEARLQARLTNLGFHCDPINGRIDQRTFNAISRFQKAFNVKKDQKIQVDEANANLKKFHEDPKDWTCRPFTDEYKLHRSLEPPPCYVDLDTWNRINIVDGPQIVLDGHMHVMSGRCSPMPLTWDKMRIPVIGEIRLDRGTVEKQVVRAVRYLKEDLIPSLKVKLHNASVELAKLADTTIDKAEHAATRLTVNVATGLIATGYAVTEAEKAINTAAAQAASRMLGGIAQILATAATVDQARAAIDQLMADELRKLAEEDAKEAAQLIENSTDLAGKMLAGVEAAYRLYIDSQLETQADMLQLASNLEGVSAQVDQALSEAAARAASGMVQISNEMNRQLDLNQAHAEALINYLANEVEAMIRAGAQAAHKKVKIIDKLADKAQRLLDSLRNKLPLTFVEFGGKKTVEIARIAVNSHHQVVSGMPLPKDAERLSILIAMPMDMDFGQIDGYEGKQIYQKVETRNVCEVQVTPIKFMQGVPVMRYPLPPGETKPPWFDYLPNIRTRIYEEKGPFYYCMKRKGSRGDRELIWMNPEEFGMFEPYPKQVEDHMTAAAENPWSLLPFYHYDPRRWSCASGAPKQHETFHGKQLEVFPQAWDEPFKRYFDDPKAHFFAGFKQYTALGYRPLDPYLPHQLEFYRECQKRELPITCHGSPGGMYSFDRPWYAAYDAQKQNKRLQDLERETKQMMEARKVGTSDWEEYYFCEHFVSPRAWRKVLEQFPSLRLCLAHFGGMDDKKYTRWSRDSTNKKEMEMNSSFDWDQELIAMAAKYDNLYIDISYFLVDVHFTRFIEMLEKNPRLKEKIIFGTDWWMTEKDVIDLPTFTHRAKTALDRMDPELWYRFSWVNPMKFIGLKERSKKIREALNSADVPQKQAAGRGEIIERGLRLIQNTEEAK